MASDHLEHDLSTKNYSQSSDEKCFAVFMAININAFHFVKHMKTKFMQPFACCLNIYPSRIPWIKDAVGQ